MPLAVAMPDAVPPEIVAGRIMADAPEAGPVKVITPPSTGSSGLFAETETLSGFVKMKPEMTDCPSPPVAVIVYP